MKLFSGTIRDGTEDERITSTIYNEEDNSRDISKNTFEDTQNGVGERTKVLNKTPIISLKTAEGGSR